MSFLHDSILALRDDTQVDGLSRFFKTAPGQYGEGDQFLGIKVPRNREVVNRIWKECSFDDLEECIVSPYHEIRLAALLTLEQIFKHTKRDKLLQQRCVDFYLTHTTYINNWDLVDLSCYEILGVWLLDKDRTLLYDLARNGKNLWEQRIAIVSCMTFVRHDQYDDCLAIADILLHHKEDLIHKAVGWLLREVGKHDQPTLVAYLAPRYKSMPRTTLRYAIEKFPPDTRRAYLQGVL